MSSLPEQIIARFRDQAMSDLEALETAWLTLVEKADASLGLEMQRRAHRLKGDARVVGFADVNVVCQRLEDLLVVAQRLDYQVSEELELVVTMALRFIALLLEKRAGTPQAGLDLAGFMEATDSVLKAHRGAGVACDVAPAHKVVAEDTRLPAGVRERLRKSALDVYLEMQRADGDGRRRLRATWQQLTALLQDDAVLLGNRLSHHAAATRALARQLGKQIHLTMHLGEVIVPSHVGELLNTALLHLCANAVDHGIEEPGERQARGKPPLGQIRVLAEEQPQALRLTVEDDGRGVDFREVRQRAVAAGLIAADVEPSEAELTYLLFYPRFSLRDEVSGVSGRGIGLDAVKALLAEGNGRIDLAAQAGAGTTVTLQLPLAPRRVPVHLFDGPVPFCVPADLTISDGSGEANDPLGALGIRVGADKVVRVAGASWAATWMVPSLPRVTTGERPCAGEPHPLEVVHVEGRDALLIRGRAD